MAEAKFTSGPWAEHGKGGCDCGQIFGPDGNAVICMVFGPGNTGIDGPDCVPSASAQKANARLIAAAPDLYAALLAALSYVKSYRGDPGMSPRGRELQDAAQARVEAALRKADGT